MKPLTLRFLLVFILIGAQLMALGGILYALDREADRIARGHTQEVIQHVAETVADKTRRFIQPAEQAVSLTRILIQRAVLNAANDAELERYFLSQLNTAPQLAGMFLGRNDGSFVFVTRVPDGLPHQADPVAWRCAHRRTDRAQSVNGVETGRALDPDDAVRSAHATLVSARAAGRRAGHDDLDRTLCVLHFQAAGHHRRDRDRR